MKCSLTARRTTPAPPKIPRRSDRSVRRDHRRLLQGTAQLYVFVLQFSEHTELLIALSKIDDVQGKAAQAQLARMSTGLGSTQRVKLNGPLRTKRCLVATVSSGIHPDARHRDAQPASG